MLLCLGLAYPIARVLVALIDVKLQCRTDEAKEKFADSLMSISNTIDSALMIGLFVFPVTAYIQAFVGGTDPLAALQTWMGSGRVTWLHSGVLIAIFLLPLLMAHLFRRRALDLYDDLARKSWP